MFGFLKKKKQALPPEIKDIFRRLHDYLEDENAQNMRLPPMMREAVLAGEDVDILSSNTSEQFGRVVSNPIPVNGPIGEVLYLSALRSMDDTPILFHRLGSFEKVDVYETVTLDGKQWDILFLDMYHPRKSRMAPKGYRIKPNLALFTGTNARVNRFPGDLQEEISICTKRLLGFPMPNTTTRLAIENTRFNKTPAHEALISVLRANGLTINKTA